MRFAVITVVLHPSQLPALVRKFEVKPTLLEEKNCHKVQTDFDFFASSDDETRELVEEGVIVIHFLIQFRLRQALILQNITQQFH